ncbi:hypothetical protein V8C42DRAFT_315323 [Trichoderma barbatum]
METILEDETEATTPPPPADPEIPPLFYVETPEKNGVYVRSFKLDSNVFPPYLQPVPLWMKSVIAMDNTPLLCATPSMFPPLFFYSAKKPLPSEFVIPYRDRPSSFYVSLTHDLSLVNIHDDPPRVRCGPAAQKVLRTPELLESIFLKLDMVTILTSIQRVNKTFKRVVDGSLALQRKLYFKPDGKAKTGFHPQEKWLKDGRTEFPILNTLLVRYFGSCFFNFGGVYGWQRRAESFYENRWTRHHHRLKKVETAFGHRMVYKSVGPELGGVETLQATQDRDRFTRAGASWRKMLVCQPPIFDFGALIFQPVEPRSFLPQRMEKGIIKADDIDTGLCMGQLYDFVQDRAGNHPLDSLWFRLTWFDIHGPFTSDLCGDTANEMFLETPVVVEMFHKRDCFPPYHPIDPPNREVFNNVFRCAEFKPHKWVPDETAIDYQDQGYAPASPLIDVHKRMIWCGFSST